VRTPTLKPKAAGFSNPATKDERHRLVTKYRLLGFESLRRNRSRTMLCRARALRPPLRSEALDACHVPGGKTVVFGRACDAVLRSRRACAAERLAEQLEPCQHATVGGGGPTTGAVLPVRPVRLAFRSDTRFSRAWNALSVPTPGVVEGNVIAAYALAHSLTEACPSQLEQAVRSTSSWRPIAARHRFQRRLSIH
jgi:hypothetical protein